MGIENYSITAGNNNAAPPNGAPENMQAGLVNNVIRQVMADLRAWFETAQWVNHGYTHSYASSTSFTIAGANVTAIYAVGRRVKATGASTGTIYGVITASAFSTHTTVTVAWDSGSLSNEALTVCVSILTPGNQAMPAFIDSLPIVVGSSDASKKARFEVDGLTTATTRVYTLQNRNGTLADTTDLALKADASSLASYALLASPTFTGTPAAPTAAAGTNTTQIATTAFVQGEKNTSYAQFEHQRPANTGGGTATAGSLFKTPLNTVVVNTISGAGLSSDVITLPAGTYYVEYVIMGFACNNFVTKLRNTSDGTDAILGTIGYSNSSVSMMVNSCGAGRFTLAGNKNFELQMRVVSTSSPNGLGLPANLGQNEVYSCVKIWKLA